MKIGLDVDGVVYPWHYSIYRYFTEFKGFSGNQREFWDYFKAFPDEKQDYYVSLPHLYNDTIPSSCVIDALNSIATLGEMYYITARWSDDLKLAAQKFFDKYNVPFKENLIFNKDKATTCRLLGIDAYIDDLPRNLIPVQNVCDCYLMAAPHNYKDRDGFKVVNSLKEFYNEIKRID